MKSKLYFLLVICCSSSMSLAAKGIEKKDEIFNNIYPISDNPNINWKTSMNSRETILFETNPIVRYSFYNNIRENFSNNHKKGIATYLSYRPELRMYTDNSVPVKMPSYRILLGVQQVFRYRTKNLIAYSFESGHYSNGQDGSAFSKQYPDGSPQSDSVIAAITPKTNLSQILNRENGEFSTDLTELILNYRINTPDNKGIPKVINSFKIGATFYHDKFLFFLPFGGYANNLIDIYGRWRFMESYEYTQVCSTRRNNRFSLSEYVEYINGAHSFVDPVRLEFTGSFFFQNNFGFFMSFISGHDNYNIRFVDSGPQISFGCVWNGCPPFKI